MISILLAGDEAVVGSALRRSLAGFGFEVRIARTVESASRMARRRRFDAILLEFNLRSRREAEPRTGGGLRVLRELRRSGVATPVLIFTTAESKLCRSASYEAGANDFVVKTDGISRLASILRAHIAETGKDPAGE